MNSTLRSRTPTYLAASVAFALLLVAFWFVARSLSATSGMGAAFVPAFASFAFLLAPLWFFAFGVADHLRAALRSTFALILAPAILALPYLLFSIPLHRFQPGFALALALIPVALSALLTRTSQEPKLLWQDVVVLLVLAFALELGLLSGAWPQPGLGSLPKLYLADVALYLYLVVRPIEGMGYSFVPSSSAFLIGLREWFFYAPFAFGLGFSLRFIKFFPRTHTATHIAAGIVEIFLLTAVSEELFFRGILQNLLEPITGRGRALAITAVLFGLSHFHKGAVFNWRYVILAAIAGVFYGRAWRAKRQLLASSITHTTVDLIWSLWFR
jgi:uncharacterized protein